MLVKIKQGIKLFMGQVRGDIIISLQQIKILSAFFPDFHGIALHQNIGFFSTHSFLRQRQKYLWAAPARLPRCPAFPKRH